MQVLADSAYGSAATRTTLTKSGHDTVIKPIPLRSPVPGGFTIDDFTIDTAAGTVTCPASQTVQISAKGRPTFGMRCRDCPLRDRCTTSSRGRTIKNLANYDVLHVARRAADDPGWQSVYRQHRPMVERSVAWLVADGHRRVRFRGTDRNRMWLDHRVPAINLRQLIRRGLDHIDGAWAIQNRSRGVWWARG